MKASQNKRYLTTRLSAMLMLLLAAGMLFASACSDNADSLAFENQLDTVVNDIYIMPASQDAWDAPVNHSRINRGHVTKIDFDGLDKKAQTYNVCAVDGNGFMYEAFAVSLSMGDRIVLSGNGESATYVIIHSDGARDSFAASIRTD